MAAVASQRVGYGAQYFYYCSDGRDSRGVVEGQPRRVRLGDPIFLQQVSPNPYYLDSSARYDAHYMVARAARLTPPRSTGLIAFLFVQQWFEVDRYIKLLQVRYTD